MTKQIIAQGAEAIIYLEKDTITKHRISKPYRHPELDKKIIKRRTKSETKLLKKASEFVNAPYPEDQKDINKIVMPFIDGLKLSEHLDSFKQTKQEKIMFELGKSIGKLHKEHIIHGDLTTSNIIFIPNKRNSNNSSNMGRMEGERSAGGRDKIFLMDFGLGYFNGKYEDKAVDIHLLKQALEAKHFKNWETLFNEFEIGYRLIEPTEAEKVFDRMKVIEKRGRYKD